MGAEPAQSLTTPRRPGDRQPRGIFNFYFPLFLPISSPLAERRGTNPLSHGSGAPATAQPRGSTGASFKFNARPRAQRDAVTAAPVPGGEGMPCPGSDTRGIASRHFIQPEPAGFGPGGALLGPRARGQHRIYHVPGRKGRKSPWFWVRVKAATTPLASATSTCRSPQLGRGHHLGSPSSLMGLRTGTPLGRPRESPAGRGPTATGAPPRAWNRQERAEDPPARRPRASSPT